jgi:hypothetical protein
MQQVALPSLYVPRRRAVPTPAFPLVRQREVAARRPRKFLAGLLFGVLMSLTLVLLGYEARLYADQHPTVVQDALNTARSFLR